MVTKEKVRSGWTVIKVGIGTPGSMCAVRALNSLQKSMDFTPRAPRAGPTGGEGAALPAGMRRRCRNKLEPSAESKGSLGTYDYLSSSIERCFGHSEVRGKEGDKPKSSVVAARVKLSAFETCTLRTKVRVRASATAEDTSRRAVDDARLSVSGPVRACALQRRARCYSSSSFPRVPTHSALFSLRPPPSTTLGFFCC